VRIEKISPNKIRIFISREDLQAWNIDFNSVTGNTPAAQDMFWAFMEQAEREVNFVVDDSQLIVEAMSDCANGLFMLVTKVTGNEKRIKTERREKIRNKEYRIRRKEKSPNVANFIYKFNNFDELVDATKQVASKFLGKSKLYKFSEDFYLHITLGTNEPIIAIDTTMVEYGRRILYHAISDGFLSEHGKLLIEDSAVEALANNF